jgi:hypothetical protein
MDVCSPAHDNDQARQQFVRTWKMFELAASDYKYEHSISPRPAAVAEASHHLNDVATDINAAAETFLTVVQPCEQFMHVMSPMSTTF